jgi:hypothetical protein
LILINKITNILNKQYYLDFEIADCRYAFLVNNIPWYNDGSGGSLATRVLIHQFIYEGTNTLTVNISPLSENGFAYTTYFEARIMEIDDQQQEKILLELKYRFNDAKPLPAYKGEGNFEIEKLDFTPAAWLACKVKKIENRQQSIIMRYYNKLYTLCRTGAVDSFMKEALIKDKYFMERFELDPAIRLPYVKEKFSDLFTNWAFSDYDHTIWNLKSYAQNRLFTFELANGNSPIEFSNKLSQMKVNIPVYLTLVNDEAQWVL